MARKVFFSFHYDPDCWRASQIRNIGALEGNSPVSDNKWEEIKKGGDAAIEKWIGAELSGKSCAIVLIGANTAGRKWINHEIEKAWNDGKGVLGIYIHNLKNREGYQSQKGANPFETFTMKRDKSKLSNLVSAYDPPYASSKDVYNYIVNNIDGWVENAIKVRANY
jgi:hypothetical protein